MSDKSPDAGRLTSRRGFLKVAGTAAIGLMGAASLPGLVRKALAAAPVWTAIPNQVWAVGVPVRLDLAAYCTDPDGDPLTFSISPPLPPGLALNGSVISGTPTQTFSTAQFVATADDARDTIPPSATSDLREK